MYVAPNHNHGRLRHFILYGKDYDWWQWLVFTRLDWFAGLSDQGLIHVTCHCQHDRQTPSKQVNITWLAVTRVQKWDQKFLEPQLSPPAAIKTNAGGHFFTGVTVQTWKLYPFHFLYSQNPAVQIQILILMSD